MAGYAVTDAFSGTTFAWYDEQARAGEMERISGVVAAGPMKRIGAYEGGACLVTPGGVVETKFGAFG